MRFYYLYKNKLKCGVRLLTVLLTYCTRPLWGIMRRAPGFKNRRIWLDFSKIYELGHHFTCLNPNSLLVKWRWAMHLIAYPSSLIIHVVGTVISFVQERKLKFRKDKWLTEVYVARKRGSLGMNPGLSGFKVSWKKNFSPH